MSLAKIKISILAAIACLLAIVAAVVIFTFRTELSVDLNSGAVKREVFVCDFSINSSVSNGPLADAITQTSSSNDWHVDSVKWLASNRHERPAYHGAISSLQELAQGWALSSTSPEERKIQAREALLILKSGKRLSVTMSDEHQLIIASSE